MVFGSFVLPSDGFSSAAMNRNGTRQTYQAEGFAGKPAEKSP